MANNHQFLALALMFQVCTLQIPGRIPLFFTLLFSLEFLLVSGWWEVFLFWMELMVGGGSFMVIIAHIFAFIFLLHLRRA